jgi:hypothetical protein
VSRRTILAIAFVGLLANACNTDLGLDQPDCNKPALNTHVLAAQAVSTAKYTPCIEELRLGWDSIDWFARDGRAGIEFRRGVNPFLTVTVADSCDHSNAQPARSGHPIGYPDIERFEDVEFVPVVISVTIIPLGEGPLASAERIVEQLGSVEIEDRRVIFTIDDDFSSEVTPRVNRALTNEHYVWIISNLDAEEKTIEMRSNNPAVTGTALRPDEALELIEDELPDLFYRGAWYFTFEGGCITYDFDAEGIVAITVADDADDALGFYPAHELRRYARDAGFDID